MVATVSVFLTVGFFPDRKEEPTVRKALTVATILPGKWGPRHELRQA
jgi:hypothetical protein